MHLLVKFIFAFFPSLRNYYVNLKETLNPKSQPLKKLLKLFFRPVFLSFIQIMSVTKLVLLLILALTLQV
jgi:hypothetical protein